MLSRHRFCCCFVFAQRFTLTLVRVTHFTHYPIYNFSIYWLFLYVICIDLHSLVDILVDFEPMYPGFESRKSHVFFLKIFYIFFFMFFFFFCYYYYSANLQIQHYCLYSVSPTLLLLMMPRPQAPSALWLFSRFLYICLKPVLTKMWFLLKFSRPVYRDQ